MSDSVYIFICPNCGNHNLHDAYCEDCGEGGEFSEFIPAKRIATLETHNALLWVVARNLIDLHSSANVGGGVYSARMVNIVRDAQAALGAMGE